MKVALVLTGLARKVEEGYDQYWKHIVENYDTDLYLHCWKDEDWESVKTTYPNHRFLIEQHPFKFTEDRKGIESPGDDKSRPLEQYDVWGNFRQFPMFYSWEYMFDIMKNIPEDYDCVIRSRYDLGSHTPLILENLDMDMINISNTHWPNSEILDDNLCITNQNTANSIFHGIYQNVRKNCLDTGEITFAEKSFTETLKRKGLYPLVQKSNHMHFNLLRDNKLWY